MDITTINIIVIGIIAFGIIAIFMNQIELASVALGGIVGFLSKQNITIQSNCEEEAICNVSEC